MTYSMCCQRATRLCRLPTLTLPATAPTDGSAKGCTRRRTESGSKTVSPSTITTSSWRAAATPALRALAFPPLGLRMTSTLGSPSASTMSAVPSVDPSSTTMTSMPGWSPAASDRTAAAMPSFSLYAGTITDTGSDTGGPQDHVGERRRRAWRPARASSRRVRPAASAPTATKSIVMPASTPSAIPTTQTSAVPRHRAAAEAAGFWARAGWASARLSPPVTVVKR
jgi:hypothetical protein